MSDLRGAGDGTRVPRPVETGLVRAMGITALAAGIVNVTIGGGIFRLPSAAASLLGPSAFLAYLLCGVAMALIVTCFAEAGSRVSLTGGLYAYTEVAFGPLVGFLVGVMLWAGLTVALSAVATFFVDSIAALVPGLGPVGRVGVLAVTLGALAALNAIGVRAASRFNGVMTVAKLLPLLLFIVAGAFAIRAPNLHVASTPPFADVGRASVVLIFAFLGIEAGLVPSGEVRDPARTVPRAIALAMVGVTAVYLAVHLVAQGILGASLAAQKTPVAEAAGVALGGWGRTLILVGSSLSMFGYVSGMTLSAPRVLYAFARDGFLPRALARVHPRWHTPTLAIAVQTVLVFLLAASGKFEQLAVIANGTVLAVYAACCLAVLELRRRDVRIEGKPFRAPAGGAIPLLAVAAIGVMMWQLKPREWGAVGLTLLLGLVAYAVAKLRRADGKAPES